MAELTSELGLFINQLSLHLYVTFITCSTLCASSVGNTNKKIPTQTLFAQSKFSRKVKFIFKILPLTFLVSDTQIEPLITL